MKPLYLSTTSKLKTEHYQDFFGRHGFEVKALALEIPELQSIEPDKVVLEKLKIAQTLTDLRPLLVDDVGLSIPGLKGFPGALLKPILELGGLRLLRDLSASHSVDHRIEAEFICAVAMALSRDLDNDAGSTGNGDDTHNKNRTIPPSPEHQKAHSIVITSQGSMCGVLDFSNEAFLEDRASVRCFYPEGSTESIAEIMLTDPSVGFQHRYQAMEQLLAKMT